jgi:phage terminase large subunit-like protein
VNTLSARSGGPRPRVTAAPLDLSGLGHTRATRAINFIERYCVLPTGKGALAKVKLRPWQKRIIRNVLAPKVRQGLLVLPRGNGKTSLAAFLALWALMDGPLGARVLCVAGVSERQARLVFEKARRMIELNTVLAEQVQVFQDKLVAPHHDGVLAPLPADADALQGYAVPATEHSQQEQAAVNPLNRRRLRSRPGRRGTAAGTSARRSRPSWSPQRRRC